MARLSSTMSHSMHAVACLWQPSRHPIAQSMMAVCFSGWRNTTQQGCQQSELHGNQGHLRNLSSEKETIVQGIQLLTFRQLIGSPHLSAGPRQCSCSCSCSMLCCCVHRILPGQRCPMLACWPRPWHYVEGIEDGGQALRLFTTLRWLEWVPRAATCRWWQAGHAAGHWDMIQELLLVGGCSLDLEQLRCIAR